MPSHPSFIHSSRNPRTMASKTVLPTTRGPKIHTPRPSTYIPEAASSYKSNTASLHTSKTTSSSPSTGLQSLHVSPQPPRLPYSSNEPIRQGQKRGGVPKHPSTFLPNAYSNNKNTGVVQPSGLSNPAREPINLNMGRLNKAPMNARGHIPPENRREPVLNFNNFHPAVHQPVKPDQREYEYRGYLVQQETLNVRQGKAACPVCGRLNGRKVLDGTKKFKQQRSLPGTFGNNELKYCPVCTPNGRF